MRPQQDWRRYAAPAAFLLAVTIAVALVRSGLEHGSSSARTTTTTTSSIPPSPQVVDDGEQAGILDGEGR